MFCRSVFLALAALNRKVLSNTSKSVTLASEFFLEDGRETGDKFGMMNGSLTACSGNKVKYCILLIIVCCVCFRDECK